MKIRSANQSHFAQVPSAQIQRSQFNRSHGYKTTLDAGYLVPVFLDEVLPGDTFNLKMTAFARLATPLVPIMDNLYFDTQFFFIPKRLVWDNWQRFCGEQDDPGDSIAFTIPQAVAPVGGYANGTLQDYMGLPTEVAGYSHNNLPLRAYNLVYNTWYRDQNLQNSSVVDKDNGPDTVTDYVLLRRGKRHDYFTSCLPDPQKGTAVSLPLGTSANIDVIAVADRVDGTNNPILEYAAGTVPGADQALTAEGASGQITDPANNNFYMDPRGSLFADLSTATAATINALREAFQIQRLLERDMRGGTRYIEIILSHFGVRSPDARLQRPELLCTYSQPINISPIAQTSEAGATPQANLAAIGTMGSVNKGFVKSFTEHGYIIGIASVRADLNYQQGLDRMWSRSTRYDFYWPAFANLGEQAVLNKEIYCDNTANDDDVFGYQERFAEYRYKPNKITGQFRSSFAQSLDVWHLAQDFGTLPVLNASFIAENPAVDRVIATPAEPHLLLDCHFDLKCARPMPVYSVPGLIDHF